MHPLSSSSEKLRKVLNTPDSHRAQRRSQVPNLRLPDHKPLGNHEILFEKIEDGIIDAQIAKTPRLIDNSRLIAFLLVSMHTDCAFFQSRIVNRKSEMDLIDDRDSVTLKPDYFFGMISKQTDFPRSKCPEDLGANAIDAQITAGIRRRVCLQWIGPVDLNRVRSDLINKVSAFFLLPKIHQDSPVRLLDELQGSSQFIPPTAMQ
jgi:hypothetical protein